MNLKTLGKGLVALVVIFCVLFTATFAFVVASNINNLGQAAKVGSLIKTQALKDVSFSELIEGTAKGMVGALDDPYSTYLEPEVFEDMQERIGGTYGGVGLLITATEDDRLKVVTPFKGGPSHRKGIASGDIITKVDGESTLNMDIETASNIMKGKPGTKVTLTVFREGRGEKKYTITREEIEIPSVDGSLIKEKDNIGYISISMFNEKTGKELQEKLQDLQSKGMEALILDLRNNPGGALSAAVESADVFLDKGPIVHIKGKNNQKVYKAQEGEYNAPVVVLINEGSASASEILSGAIKDTNSGVIIGENSFGKGIVQSIFRLDDGAAVKLTTAKYLTPDKRDIHKKGIKPDIKVELSQEETAQALLNAPNIEKDPQLQKALEILQKKLKK